LVSGDKFFIERVGWRASDAFAVVTDQGDTIWLDREAPTVVQQRVKEATRRLVWKEWPLSAPGQPLFPAPFLAPVHRVLERYWKAGKTSHAGWVRGMVVGSLRSMRRRFELGLVDTDLCQACHSEVGTWQHRLWRCPCQQAARDAVGMRHWLHLGATAPEGHLLWSRGLVPDPARSLPAPPVDDHREWWLRGIKPDVCYYTGLAYTDGSGGVYSQWKDLRRCGWCGVSVSPGGKLIFGRYGPLPSSVQTTPVAELWAFYQVVRYAVPPLAVGVDCDMVVKGWRRGADWCTSSRRRHAWLWRLIWACLDEMRLPSGQPGVVVFKVKSHRTLRSMEDATDEEWRDYRGNELADEGARLGAEAVELLPGVAFSYIETFRKVEDVLVFAAELSCCDELVPDVERGPWRDDDEIRKAAETRGAWPEQDVTPVGGSALEVQAGPLDRLAEQVGAGHALMVSGDKVLWCSKCAAFASGKWARSLRDVCIEVTEAAEGGGAGRRQRRKLLEEGRHPVTRVRLGDVRPFVVGSRWPQLSCDLDAVGRPVPVRQAGRLPRVRQQAPLAPVVAVPPRPKVDLIGATFTCEWEGGRWRGPCASSSAPAAVVGAGDVVVVDTSDESWHSDSSVPGTSDDDDERLAAYFRMVDGNAAEEAAAAVPVGGPPAVVVQPLVPSRPRWWDRWQSKKACRALDCEQADAARAAWDVEDAAIGEMVAAASSWAVPALGASSGAGSHAGNEQPSVAGDAATAAVVGGGGAESRCEAAGRRSAAQDAFDRRSAALERMAPLPEGVFARAAPARRGRGRGRSAPCGRGEAHRGGNPPEPR